MTAMIQQNSELEAEINFILSHLALPLFPRMIMTKRLGYQKMVFTKDEMLREFEFSEWQDCRISAYPILTNPDEVDSIYNLNPNIKAPSFVLIDIDLGTKSREDLDKILKSTLKTRLNESLSEFQENDDFSLEVKEEEVISMINVLTQQPNMAIDYHPTENNTYRYPGESSSRTLIFDTKDLFPTST